MSYILGMLSWGLFWVGCIVSKLMNIEINFSKLYPVYNSIMNKSYDINVKCGKGPWK